MEPKVATDGGWSRLNWALVAILTAVGLAGILVDFVAFFAIHGPLTGGCAFGGVAAALMIIALLLVLAYAGFAGALALTGLIFFWRRSRWGPRLLIPSNLLSMAFFFWSPVNPGQVDWVAILVLLAAAPAVAVAMLVWPLLSRAAPRVWIVELVVLLVIALPLVAAYIYGIETDVVAAFAPPPPLVAAAHGCGGSAAALTAPQTP